MRTCDTVEIDDIVIDPVTGEIHESLFAISLASNDYIVATASEVVENPSEEWRS